MAMLASLTSREETVELWARPFPDFPLQGWGEPLKQRGERLSSDSTEPAPLHLIPPQVVPAVPQPGSSRG